MQNTAYPNNTPAKKHSRKRQTVQISGWGRPQLKTALQRLAESEGISFSQTIIAILEAGVREKLHIQQEILAEPIMRKLLREELRPLRNDLSEFHGRSLFEIGQVRWLFINKLYREVLNPEKKFTKEEFYKLLDTSRKETIQSIKQWNHTIIEVVAAIKKRLAGEKEQV
jgi:hypothetical protein